VIVLTVACTLYSTNASGLRRAITVVASKPKYNTCDANPAGSSKCGVLMKPCIYGCDNCQSVCYPCASLYADFKCATEGAQPEQVHYETCRNIEYACGQHWGSSCKGKSASINCLGWKGTCIQHSDNVTPGCPAPKNATKGHVTTMSLKEVGHYSIEAITGLYALYNLQNLLRENINEWRKKWTRSRFGYWKL